LKMLARTPKAALLIMAVGTVSMASLTLPAARAISATLPAFDRGLLSCTQIKELIRRTHDDFGDIAAEVACTYLKKLGVPQGAFVPVRAGTDQDRMKTKEAEPGAEASALLSER